MTTMVWWGIIIYIIISLFVAFLSRTGKQTTMGSYFLGDRKLNGFVSALSYSATTYSAFMLVGLAGLTYKGGVGALGFELIYLMGVSLVAFFGPRFWIVGKKFGYVTPSEMLGDRYDSRKVAAIISIASCIFLIPYSAVQLSGVGYLLQGMTNNEISFSTGVLLATIVATVFSYIAGIRSVAWTDSLQALFMIVTSTIVVFLIVQKLGGGGAFFDSIEGREPSHLAVPGNGFWSFPTFLSMTIPWFFFSLSNPQVSQRLFMPKSLKSMRTMLLGFMVFGFVYTLVAVTWGFASFIMFPNLENPDMATATILSSNLVPPIFAVIVMVGIIAAAISTIDSILLTLSSLFARDVYGYFRKDVSDAEQLQIGKFIIPVIAIFALLFAELELNLIAVLSVASSAGLLVFVPAIIGAFFWKRGTAAGVIISVLIAGLSVVILELGKIKPFGFGSGIWGLLLSTLLFVIVSLVTKAPKEKAHLFMTTVQEELSNIKK